ncbi:MAG: hypothetical protein WHT09_14775 [Thermogutta sp.]|jgi:hypothetical protein
MPTSEPRTLSIVHDIILRIKPSSVIDIGVGHGKTGVLVREYTDIWHERYDKHSWTTRIYGIEAFAQYRNALWDYAYDDVYIGDALSVLPGLPNVDLIVALDVWEHLSREYAEKLLELCLNKSRFLLLSTPIVVREQGDVLGNAYERHVSQWSPADFEAVAHRLVATTGRDWILLLSSRERIPYDVWRLHRRWEHLMRGVRSFFLLLKHKNW